MNKVAVAGLLGLLLAACNIADQGTAGRAYTDDRLYSSQHPVGREFQVRVVGFAEPVTAVLKEDRAFVGDIVVGRLEGRRVVAPDKQVILDLGGDALTPQGTGYVNVEGRKWPGGVVPYVFDPSATQVDRDAFLGAKADYDAKTAVRFVPRTNQADYVNVVSKPGCYSYVGRIGGAQELSLGNGCGVNPARHELGHALGLSHEQVRQDRDQWVVVNAGGSQNAIDNGPAGTPIGPYDFQSMMHYRNYFVNGRWDYLPKNGFPPERVGNDEINTFTPGDLNAIVALYGPPPTATGPVCFFENSNYGGASFCAAAAGAAVGDFWNDRISSVRVQSGFRAELFSDVNYGGSSKTLAGDTASLPDFNDRASSFRVVRTTPTGTTLPLEKWVSFRVRTPGLTNRYLRHSGSLAYTDVVAANSPTLLKQDASFRIVRALDGTPCYSFESRNLPGSFLRHQGSRLRNDTFDGSDTFRQDATFCARTGLAGNGGVSLVSRNLPGAYIRHFSAEVWLAKRGGPLRTDAAANFDEDSSWDLPDAWAP